MTSLRIKALRIKALLPLFALAILPGCGGGSEGTGLGISLQGLEKCVQQLNDQSLLCGSVTTEDGVTPLPGVELRLERDTTLKSSFAEFSNRGIADENQCLTDPQGEYACVLPPDVSGNRTFNLTPPDSSGTEFEPASFEVDIQAGEITTVPPQILRLSSGDSGSNSLSDELEPIDTSGPVNSIVPLVDAVFAQSLERVQELLAQGENPDVARQRDGATPLLVAAQEGYTDIAEALLDGGADPDKGSRQFTPLMYTAHHGHLDTATLLLKKGASVFVARDDNWTALHSAVSRNRESVTALLINARAPLDAQVRGWTPLTYAAQEGFTVVIDLLLNAGAEPLGSPENGATPLLLAAQNGHIQAAERLLVGGADPDNGGTADAPLVIAAAFRSTGVLEVLVAGGATVDIRSSRNDWTGLMWAANNNDIETLRELLRLQADRSLRDPSGRTARDIAEALGHSEAALLLG